MPLDADMLVDRRRLKRRLGLWRFLAVLLALVLVGAVALRGEFTARGLLAKPQIARVTLAGLIQEDRAQLRLLRKIGDDAGVAALIVIINSPGGTTTGGEALYEAFLDVAEKKPVVAVMGTIATSAGYLVALATDRIFARSNTITGSVGVIFQWAEVTELMKTLGVKVEEVTSGPLKANPSLFEPMNDDGRRVAEQMVNEAKDWFVGLVAKERGLDPATVPGLAEGRVYSGRMALDNRLIDAIGDEPAAVAWLEAERGVPRGLDVIDWKPEEGAAFGLLGSAAGALARVFGIGRRSLAGFIGETAMGGVRLDGLVSLWHPRMN